MDLLEIRHRLDQERRSLVRRGEAIEILPDVTRLHSADGSHCSVISSTLDASTADAVIDREVAHHRALGVGFEWKAYSHDEPTDLLERLGRHGFEIGAREAVMILPLTVRPAWLDDISPAAVARVDALEQVNTYRATAEEIFGKSYAFTADQLADGIRRGSTQHRGYLAFCGNKPVSIGRLYTHPESWFGGLYGAATLPEFRGKGFYRALIARRARDAMEAEAKWLIVDALATSAPILKRMGFVRLTDTWPCQWSVES